MKVNIELLERFYSGDYDFHDYEKRELLVYLRRLKAGRLNEFVSFLTVDDFIFHQYIKYVFFIWKEENAKIKYIKDKTKFSKFVASGYLNLIKYFIEKYDIYIHAFNGEAFRIAAERGYAHIIEYFISLEPTHGPVNIHVDNDYAFRIAAANGHVNVLKLLISLEPTHDNIHTHIDYDYAFRMAAANGHVDVLKYLIGLEYTHGKINIHVNDNEAFRSAFMNYHMNVIEYLISLEDTHGRFNVKLYEDQVSRILEWIGEDHPNAKLITRMKV